MRPIAAVAASVATMIGLVAAPGISYADDIILHPGSTAYDTIFYDSYWGGFNCADYGNGMQCPGSGIPGGGTGYYFAYDSNYNTAWECEATADGSYNLISASCYSGTMNVYQYGADWYVQVDQGGGGGGGDDPYCENNWWDPACYGC